jgi:hypothetical protein
MNRTLLLVALAAAVPARAADEFKPIKASESVTYPLPPIPLPAAQPADGKWAETEDSPALRVSRAWVKLGQAAGVERSEATRRLYQAWKNEVAKDGTHGRVAQAAHAKFLAAYKKDLDQARSIYEGVLRDVDSLDADNPEGGTQGGEGSGGLAREAEEQLRRSRRAPHQLRMLPLPGHLPARRPGRQGAAGRDLRAGQGNAGGGWPRRRAQPVFPAAQGRPSGSARPRDGGGDAAGGGPTRHGSRHPAGRSGIAALAAVPRRAGRLGGAKRIASSR